MKREDIALYKYFIVNKYPQEPSQGINQEKITHKLLG